MLQHALFMHPSAIFQWPQNTAFSPLLPFMVLFPDKLTLWSIYLSLTPTELLGNRRVCVCVCACVCVCTSVPVLFASASTGAEFYWTVEQVWILQLDHISKRDTQSDNGAEFFTVESSTIATSNKEVEEGLVFGRLFLAYGMAGRMRSEGAGGACSGLGSSQANLFPGRFSGMPPRTSRLTTGTEGVIRKWDITQIKCYDGPRSGWVLKTHLLLPVLKAQPLTETSSSPSPSFKK